MLTQIEWWGGVLFVWGALACWSLVRLSDSPWFKGIGACAFGLVGLAFALYFYELQQPVLRYVFLGIAAAAAVALLVFVVEFFRNGDEDEDDEAEGDAEQGDEDGEESGLFAMVIGCVTLLTPLFVALGLVGFKSWTVLQLL